MTLEIHVSELPCRVNEIQYSVDVKTDDRLHSFLAFYELQTLLAVLKSVLRQHSCAGSFLQDREVLFYVRISVGLLCSELVTR